MSIWQWHVGLLKLMRDEQADPATNLPVRVARLRSCQCTGDELNVIKRCETFSQPTLHCIALHRPLSLFRLNLQYFESPPWRGLAHDHEAGRMTMWPERSDPSGRVRRRGWHHLRARRYPHYLTRQLEKIYDVCIIDKVHFRRESL